jgi:hypothetical protein|tara:strand:+ start:2180 stop:2542 length:363 start_codon:yes stop_codon:yes gene_type:complete
MKAVKDYKHGGVHYDLPKTNKEKRREDREDKKGMIPARFRNRGQAGLDDAIAHIEAKEKKKRIKAIEKAKRKKKGISKVLASWKAGRIAKRNEKDVSDSSSGAGSGCEKDGSCGALGKPK